MSDLGHYDNHPAYRYQALFVAKAFKFGRDRTSAPNIEAEIGRAGPWLTGETALALSDSGVNAVGAIFEPLTDPVFGAGFPESELHTPSFVALRLALSIEGFSISINQSEQTDMRSYLASVLEHFDGFLVRVGTQLGAGYWRIGDIDTSVLPLIGSDDLTAEPRLRSSGFDDCITEVNVVYKDREHYYHDAVASVRNPGLQQLLGEYRPITLQRPFIIDSANANFYATQYLQRFARPGYSGEIDVKLERVEAIEDLAAMPIVGQLVKVDVASIEEELVFRVVECEYPADEGPFSCTLTVELERSIWPVLFIQPPPERIGNFVVDLPNVVNYKMAELPAGLKTTTALQTTILAQRPAKSIVGFHVWDSPDDAIFVIKNPPSTYAAYGTLTVQYPSTTGDLDQTVGMTVKLFGVDLIPPSDNHILDGTVLCFIDNEILFCGRNTALGAGIYNVWMNRARYGTIKATHLVGAKAYFISADQLSRFTNKDWDVGETWHFKLQTYDNRQEFDIADFDSFPWVFTGGAVGVPTLNNPTTDFVITTEGKVNSRITQTWSYVTDYDLSGFNVRTRRFIFGGQWVTHHVGIVTSTIFENLEPNKLYEVQIQAMASTGELSAWSASKQITTAAPNIPGTPTGLTAVGIADGVVLTWNNAATGGIRGTQILFSAISGDDIHLALIDEVNVLKERYVYSNDIASQGIVLFFNVRHVNTLGVEGSHPTSVSAIPKFVPDDLT